MLQYVPVNMDIHLRLVLVRMEPRLPLDIVKHLTAYTRLIIVSAEGVLEHLAVDVNALTRNACAALQRW